MPKGKSNKKKGKPRIYNVGVYLRVGNRIYTSIQELEREIKKEKVVKKMTPEQVEFCKK